ncbi:cyclin-dependent protein kinase inhibitor SMR6-like protein [Tanacetum coccineum]
MGFSKKNDCICAPLSVSTKKLSSSGDDEGANGLTTPKAKELRLLECPMAPRKRKAVKRSDKSEKVEFFTSPELDLFFENFANSGKVNSSF